VTSEVVVCNGRTAVMAADDLVTLPSQGVYRAEKVFPLHNTAPIALMVSGRVALGGLPWSVLTQRYRAGAHSPAPTVREQAEDFLEWLRGPSCPLGPGDWATAWRQGLLDVLAGWWREIAPLLPLDPRRDGRDGAAPAPSPRRVAVPCIQETVEERTERLVRHASAQTRWWLAPSPQARLPLTPVRRHRLPLTPLTNAWTAPALPGIEHRARIRGLRAGARVSRRTRRLLVELLLLADQGSPLLPNTSSLVFTGWGTRDGTPTVVQVESVFPYRATLRNSPPRITSLDGPAPSLVRTFARTRHLGATSGRSEPTVPASLVRDIPTLNGQDLEDLARTLLTVGPEPASHIAPRGTREIAHGIHLVRLSREDGAVRRSFRLTH
jgi:hypothetical protein